MDLSDAYTNNYDKILKYKADYNARLLKKQEKSLQNQNSPLVTSENPTEKIVNKIQQKQKVLSNDEIELIVKGYKSGLSMSELAGKFGCHKITISQKLKKVGVAIRRQSPDDSQIVKMVTLYQSGLSLATVGNKTGVSASTVLRYITKQGIVTRDEHGRAK